MRVKTYRKLLWIALILTFMVLCGMWLITTYQRIPGAIKLKLGEEQVLSFGLPVTGDFSGKEEENLEAITVNGLRGSNIPKENIHIDLNNPVSVKGEEKLSYTLNLKLFGFIPFKQVDVDVVDATYLTPVGQPVGIYLKTRGILVVGTGDFENGEGEQISPAGKILKSGDYIIEVNHREINLKKDFVSLVENSDGEPMVLKIVRAGSEFEAEIYPKKDVNGVYKIGVWLRDSAQGIGTMTYMDANGNFGALGHGISDVDLNQNFALVGGSLYDTEIVSIKKGKRGKPGEMTGVISYSDSHILGEVFDNTDCGIFGKCNEKMEHRMVEEPIEMALSQEVELGKAKILCTINDKPTYYDVEIKELYYNTKAINKRIVLEITDKELIEQTGGIIQGMSGAPIVQNGKFVGAVTHVLINEPTKGYGIFAEDMTEAAKNVVK